MRLHRAMGSLSVGILLALAAGLPVIATAGSTSGTTRIYITDYLGNSASVIDGNGNHVVATARVGRAPAGMAVSPDRRFVYIANSESDTVSVLDSTSNAITGIIALPRRSRPLGLALSPDGRDLYVADGGTNRVSVIGTRSRRIVGSVRVGRQPLGVAVSPDGRTLYTANSGSGNLSVINARTRRVVRTVPTGRFPSGVAVTPDGRSVYAVNELSGVTVVNAADGRVEARLATPSPFGVAMSPDGTRAYVTNLGPGDLTVIDTRTHKVASTVRIGPPGTDPFTVQATNQGIYVANHGANTLSVIDPRTLHVAATVSTGNGPYGVVVVRSAR